MTPRKAYVPKIGQCRVLAIEGDYVVLLDRNDTERYIHRNRVIFKK